MKTKIPSALLALTLALACMLSACGGGTPTEATTTTTAPSGAGTTTTAASSQPTAGRDSLNLFIPQAVGSFDPAASTASSDTLLFYQLYEPLLRFMQDHEYEPLLADSVTISADQLTYTFNLKKGVLFHNGEEMKADDVVFTVERAFDSPFLLATVSEIASCTALDEYTVAITLKAQYAPFLESFCTSNLGVLNRKAVEAAGEDYGQNPVGTGPYRFVSYDAGSVVHMTRFDDYHGVAASIKDISFRVISDPSTSTIGIETGELDYGQVDPSGYDRVIANPKLEYLSAIASHVYYVTINNEVAPFDNKLVRQAINYAIDRQFILDVSVSGYGIPSSCMVSPVMFGYSDAIQQSYLTRDVEKAKALLVEAGITTPLDIGTIKCMDGIFKTQAEIVMQNLNEIGLICTVEIMEANKYIEDAVLGNYGIGMMGIGLGLDADRMALAFDSANINGNNLARYNNPVVDDLFVQARQTMDPQERLDIYAQLFSIVDEDAVYAPLLHMEYLYAFSADLNYAELSNPHGVYVGRAFFSDFSWK